MLSIDARPNRKLPALGAVNRLLIVGGLAMAGCKPEASPTAVVRLPTATPTSTLTPEPTRGPVTIHLDTRTVSIIDHTDNGAIANALYHQGLTTDPTSCAAEIVQLNADRGPTVLEATDNSWQWLVSPLTNLELGEACLNGPAATEGFTHLTEVAATQQAYWPDALSIARLTATAEAFPAEKQGFDSQTQLQPIVSPTPTTTPHFPRLDEPDKLQTLGEYAVKNNLLRKYLGVHLLLGIVGTITSLSLWKKIGNSLLSYLVYSPNLIAAGIWFGIQTTIRIGWHIGLGPLQILANVLDLRHFKNYFAPRQIRSLKDLD